MGLCGVRPPCGPCWFSVWSLHGASVRPHVCLCGASVLASVRGLCGVLVVSLWGLGRSLCAYVGLRELYVGLCGASGDEGVRCGSRWVSVGP